MFSPAITRRTLLPFWRGALVLLLVWESGCSHRIGIFQSGASPSKHAVELVARSNRRSDRDAARNSRSETGYMGPMERALNRSKWEDEKAEAASGDGTYSIDGLDEYQAAEALYNEGRFREAEKAFKKLAKARRNSHESFGMKLERWWGVRPAASLDTYTNFGDPIEEDALFMKAESQFEQKKYASAQDSYDALLNQYPSTRHLDAVSRRYFQIARFWLGFPEKAGDSGDVQVASAEDDQDSVQDFENVDSFYVPIVPNMFDRTRPVFDTRGRALQALRSVWLHDATGPLADDALMVSASFHLRTKDFEESARLYKLLRDQYPESPHFRDAFLLGSHVTLASYQGSNYDGQNLDEAIELKEAALRIFPDLTEEERNRLGSELNKMYDAEVARIWDRVEYFQAKQSPESVAIYCNILINKFPDSAYAERARRILEQQARSGAGLVPGLPSLTGRRGASDDADSDQTQTAEAPEEPKTPFRLPPMKWPLRRVPSEQSPPVEESPADSESPTTDESSDGEGEEEDQPRYRPRLEEVSSDREESGEATF